MLFKSGFYSFSLCLHIYILHWLSLWRINVRT